MHVLKHPSMSTMLVYAENDKAGSEPALSLDKRNGYYTITIVDAVVGFLPSRCLVY